MSAIINIISLLIGKFTGSSNTPVTSTGEKKRYIYMRRAVFVVAMALALWAIIEPESLAMRLEHASEVLPSWFTALLASVFAGVF